MTRLLLAFVLCLPAAVAAGQPAKTVKVTILSTMLVGNSAAGIGEWGFAAVLEVDGRRLLIDTGRVSGERVWPFPMDEDYDQALESSIADIKQCALEGDADHILAARFLKRFVGDRVPWVHIDLASGIRKTALAHVPTGVTGFGVRYTRELLLGTRIPVPLTRR